ncbi:MAG TPA: zinc ribbon domain-containing protein [Solirubrobacteraceae bacterium]
MSTTLEPEQITAAPPAEAPETTCPNCGAPADAGQLMCLECGSRLALDYHRPPSWRLPAAIVGIVLLLAGAAVAFALAQVTNDAGKTTANAPTQPVAGAAPADQPPAAAQPAPAASAATSSTPTPAPTASGTTTTPAPAPSAGGTPAPTPSTAASGWPPGKSAFTVIIASVPTKAGAEDKLATAKAAGISNAALLHSDDFPTLRPGYWVVFDGQYDTIDQATQQANQDKTKGEFSDAYPRFVSKDANAKP